MLTGLVKMVRAFKAVPRYRRPGFRLRDDTEEIPFRIRQIFGKFLSSAMWTHYIRDGQRVPMAGSVMFVHILDTSRLRVDATSKMRQWENLEHSIQRIIPIMGSGIIHYRLFYGDSAGFASQGATKGAHRMHPGLLDCHYYQP